MQFYDSLPTYCREYLLLYLFSSYEVIDLDALALD